LAVDKVIATMMSYFLATTLPVWSKKYATKFLSKLHQNCRPLFHWQP